MVEFYIHCSVCVSLYLTANRDSRGLIPLPRRSADTILGIQNMPKYEASTSFDAVMHANNVEFRDVK